MISSQGDIARSTGKHDYSLDALSQAHSVFGIFDHCCRLCWAELLGIESRSIFDGFLGFRHADKYFEFKKVKAIVQEHVVPLGFGQDWSASRDFSEFE